MRKKIRVTQNKCLRFCLKLNSRLHKGATELKETNCLRTEVRAEQRITTKVFKHWKRTSPFL